MGKLSRNKGKRGEAEVAHILQAAGYADAKRTAQRCGRDGTADVIGLPGFHIEVKRCETTRIHDWLDQARRDSRETGARPIVVHRRSGEPWLATISLSDLLDALAGNAVRTSYNRPQEDEINDKESLG